MPGVLLGPQDLRSGETQPLSSRNSESSGSRKPVLSTFKGMKKCRGLSREGIALSARPNGARLPLSSASLMCEEKCEDRQEEEQVLRPGVVDEQDVSMAGA